MSFLSYLINGVSLGSIYAIIALGYTMVYGIAKMLNFAHGDVIMIGAFVMLSALNTMSLPLIPAVLVAVVACTVLGVVIERVAYRPLRNAASPLAVLITAIGVSYLLQNVALLIFGANTVSFPNKITLPALSLAGGSLVISSVTIVTIVACVVIMIALLLFINRTKAGQAMLAVSEDKGAARLMGINVDGTIALTFAIGSALAAIAGFLLFTGSVQRSYAWYQGLCRSSIRRHRFCTGSNDRRYSAWYYRDSCQGLYFFPAVGCNCICSADYRTDRKADRTARKENSGESVGG